MSCRSGIDPDTGSIEPSRSGVGILRSAGAAAKCLLAMAAFGALLVPGARGVEAQERSPDERTLFLILDAVPFSSVAALEASGGARELFEELGGPAPLISTFPSTTSVALAEALGPFGLEISPGYEARFFDWRRQSIRGGGPISFFKIDFPWRRFFDWTKKSVARSAIASLRPAKVSEKRALAAFEAFLASDKSNFFAYVDSTDAAAHLRGPSSLNPMFRSLGLAIRSAREAGGSFRVVVFSDHGIAGGEPLENALPGILERIKESEFERAPRLERRLDVVLTPYGLVSSFEAYADHEVVPRLAEVLASARGVDLCAYRDRDGLWVVGPAGLAEIRRSPGRWAYVPRAGDPLRYREVLDEFGQEHPDSFASAEFSDREWFEATRTAHYPDALRRIARGFELVANPASVICSLEPGYLYGPGKTAAAARLTGGRLRWTHGALHFDASAGFLLSGRSDSTGGDGVRLAEALYPLASPALDRPRGGSPD